jgi:electron transfer flavoprotein alpha subunit
MTDTTTNAIWVFGDLRTRHLLDLSLKVLVKATVLAGTTGDRIAMFSLTDTEPTWLTVSEDETCAIQGTVEDEAIAWGADVVYLFENERFSTPSPHIFADVLKPVFKEHRPRLVLFPLTDFGRDLAARTAAVRAGRANGGLRSEFSSE